MADNDGFLTINNDNRREFSRVGAYIPFSYRIVTEAEVDHMKSRTVSDSFTMDFPIMPSLEDQIYGEWLKLINAKLDEIIRMMTLQREGFSTLPFKKINISGNGLSFFSMESLSKGTFIEAKVVLTIINASALILYGEVVKVESLGNGFNIGVRFINIDDMLRNEIIRFVFEREREMIREKRGS
ncbi:MAG: hypothetical protein CSYNP_01200 [Syntrophus sp. SKADARSKE-3]|nr:hypothetical protein [Syntrophus sp. SKADARSKE-3]